ncbi:DUF465 domain-containing protein [Novosphingobium aerophilum]|uniref:DUF465 domain-containing protein n=1 Tax=Novosphingobium TaxID=165696 RepID=UPI0006C8DE91|nr:MULTISPECIES: DUF465 domain-containing protein [unclassified Novosphingobium]KPH60328.1 hypothetical protein ADT71_20840 [Novosphingobium sp. ST904]MPS68536.1 DUF465 domain-containing protein [Novosphingobium sp.]TCM36871.1 uncharacterized protein DUF465 [Novosphingobium sp. ST904]WRT93874.1 DUF465 domain-containing protein [Novosphingobium sp. RL4]
MTDHMFRLLERHQKLDALLRFAQGRPIADPLEIAKLKRRKQEFRGRLARLLLPPSAVAHSL